MLYCRRFLNAYQVGASSPRLPQVDHQFMKGFAMEENPIIAQSPLVPFQFKTNHSLDNGIELELTEEDVESLMEQLASIKKTLAAQKNNSHPQAVGEQKSIGDILLEIASDVPEEEWDKLPKDLNKNLDHYVYGISKK